MRLTLISCIEVYQYFLSPDHSPMRMGHPHGYCRYYPTCSEYVKHAILRYGSARGLVGGIKRIARCHPWSSGGIDFVT